MGCRGTNVISNRQPIKEHEQRAQSERVTDPVDA
jgi:hypothetical protein